MFFEVCIDQCGHKAMQYHRASTRIHAHAPTHIYVCICKITNFPLFFALVRSHHDDCGYCWCHTIRKNFSRSWTASHTYRTTQTEHLRDTYGNVLQGGIALATYTHAQQRQTYVHAYAHAHTYSTICNHSSVRNHPICTIHSLIYLTYHPAHSNMLYSTHTHTHTHRTTPSCPNITTRFLPFQFILTKTLNASKQ